jgi:hypothetical protein
VRIAILAATCALVAACSGPGPTASPTQTPAPTTAFTPGPSGAEPSASLGSFACQLPVTLPASASAQTHLTDIRMAGHEGSDRIVWEFDGGLPEVQLRQGIPPFTTDPAGRPLAVSGNAFLQLTFRGASRGGADGPVTYEGPTDFDPQLPELWQVRMAGDFEATMSFILGLVDPPCFDLFTLGGPSRVVLDLAGQ